MKRRPKILDSESDEYDQTMKQFVQDPNKEDESRMSFDSVVLHNPDIWTIQKITLRKQWPKTGKDKKNNVSNDVINTKVKADDKKQMS